MKKSINEFPLFVISYLQSLANGNPRMVAGAMEYFNSLRAKRIGNEISEEEYHQKLVDYINQAPKE